MKKRMMTVLVSFALVFTAFISAAGADEIFWYPQRLNEYIFITATNGDKFCEEEGYGEMSGGTILCGEDEASYADYNWYSQRWEMKATGSKNQCYPLLRSIYCR
jgi:hypothetical protein